MDYNNNNFIQKKNTFCVFLAEIASFIYKIKLRNL